MLEAWANPFAASNVMLKGLAATVRANGGPVLELGSGLSTLVMAAANPQAEIHCLENSPVFAEHLRIEAAKLGLSNIVIHCRALKGGWYDADDLPRLAWRLVIIDGPPRKDGARMPAFERLDLSAAAVFVDDVQRDGGAPELVDALARTHNVQVITGEGVRCFAIGAPKANAQQVAA